MESSITILSFMEDTVGGAEGETGQQMPQSTAAKQVKLMGTRDIRESGDNQSVP